jgi:hypothetical protein
LIPRAARDGTVPVDLIRDSKSLQVGLPVTRDDDRLVKPYRGGYPPYFVHGPLVFSPAIEEAISFYARGNPAAMAGSPLVTRDGDHVAFPGEELVVVTSPLLPHRITKGYADPFGQVVADVDGVKVKNLRHLIELLRDGRGDFVTFRFCGVLSETMVFRRKALEGTTEQVMSENGIPRRGSDELLAIWNARPAAAR